jgi:hypothetical protein
MRPFIVGEIEIRIGQELANVLFCDMVGQFFTHVECANQINGRSTQAS